MLSGAASPNCLLVQNVNDQGPGSLRDAIHCANSTSGTDTIQFAIPGPGVHTIRPLSPLPALVDPVIVDGTTQPAAQCSDDGVHILLIELDGALAGGDAITIQGGDTTIRGMIINRFAGNGIRLESGRNQVICNHIGTESVYGFSTGNREPDQR